MDSKRATQLEYKRAAIFVDSESFEDVTYAIHKGKRGISVFWRETEVVINAENIEQFADELLAIAFHHGVIKRRQANEKQV